MSDWLARYNARKNGTAPPQQYAPPPPQYAQQPPPNYQPGYPPPPPYPASYPQPLPGAPPHAPFGYDQATGVPVAPFGHDEYGRVLVQPPYAPPPPQFQPNGFPAPQGYGQPPYGQIQPQPQAPPPPADGTPQSFHDRVRYAIEHVEGNTQGNREVQACQQCGGPVISTDANGMGTPDGMPQSAGVFNPNTGQTVYPAAHCMSCGTINKVGGGNFAPGAGAASRGIGVKIIGQPRLAPGAGSTDQVAHQHGMPNLFAPK